MFLDPGYPHIILMSQVGFHCAVCDLVFPVYEVFLEHTTSKEHISKIGGRKKARPVTVGEVWERIAEVEASLIKKGQLRAMSGEQILQERLQQERQRQKLEKNKKKKEEQPAQAGKVQGGENQNDEGHDEDVMQTMGFAAFGNKRT